MRARILIPLAAAAMLAAPASASAFFAHTVTQGESLTSIAAADGLSVAQLAAANGLPLNSFLIEGSTVQIPPQSSTLSGLSSGISSTTATSSVPASTSSSGSYVVVPGDTLSGIAARIGTTATALAAANGLDVNGILPAGAAIRLSGSPSGSTTLRVSTTSSGSGSYLVVPGDTLTAIAARAGTTPAALAAANGLDLNGILLAGSAIHVPSGSTALPVSTSLGGTAETQPVGAPAQGDPTNPPYPTPERLSASQIASVAVAHGVPPALADAIAWQESGFNNDLVSSADARGIMQILPGTWDWIQRTLTPSAPLAPASAVENVRGGVLLLRSLLNSTGGDAATAAAGYYQGLPSVQAHGMYPSTQQYVQSVQALEQRFGGG
ncbi:MAG TPA: LysM peptidoglycan-binding domain-containing protein [Solirubrobacteraceae bacterium]|nr:LysM peptidoglycan-binding domain-containing protein [Solirubrobacteraceae bacterium]